MNKLTFILLNACCLAGFATAAFAEVTSQPKASPSDFDQKSRVAAHWVWTAPQPVAVPKPNDANWPLNEIDQFILSKLESRGLSPGQDAARSVWIRRVYFDLIGLPPTIDQVTAFLADDSPAAWDNVVEHLLASPHFGEKWARHWMDLVRYAESYGHEYDYPIHAAFHYRDYLIRALNADVPYDQLVTEHIAGDLIDPPRRNPTNACNDSIIGSGFWWFGEATHAPTNAVADYGDRIDNQIDVLSKAFLGLTVACARCHDHKFDAISTEDYYALTGFLRSSRRHEAMLDPNGSIHSAADRLRRLQQDIQDELCRLRDRQLNNGCRLGEEAEPALPSELQFPLRSVAVSDVVRVAADDWFLAGEAFAQGPTQPPVTAPRDLESIDSGCLSHKLHGVARSPQFRLTDGFVRVRVKAQQATIRLVVEGYQLEPFNPLLFQNTRHYEESETPNWKWVELGNSLRSGQSAYLELTDRGKGAFAIDRVVLGQGTSGDVELTIKPDVGMWKDALLAWRDDLLTNPQFALLDWAQQNQMGLKSDRLDELRKEFRKVEASIPSPIYVIATTDGTPIDGPLFVRGDVNQPCDPVPRRFLAAVEKGLSIEGFAGSGRLALARRIVDPRSPTTARVAVNRLWHHVFGRGVVPTVDDFGVMGEPPSHPELLDWLANDFVAGGWSLKRTLRQMVLSHTYRTTSAGDDSNDPQQTWLSNMRVRRLPAESIRDAMLAVSGSFDPTIGGPSVPVYLTEFMQGRGRPESGPLDGNGRRSLYLATRRNFLSPMLTAFDFPVPFSTMGSRTVSNVPAQALTMMNDPLVRQQAELWAEQLIQRYPNSEERVSAMFLAALSEEASPSRRLHGLRFVQSRSDGSVDQQAEQETWSDLCHMVFNMKEFIFLR